MVTSLALQFRTEVRVRLRHRRGAPKRGQVTPSRKLIGHPMRPFKFFWNTHKWSGIVLSVLLLNLAGTGLLLLVKKRFEALQPPTQHGTPGGIGEFLPIDEVIARVLDADHVDFQRAEDIDRIDLRVGKRVHKVRSKHNYSEIQVDAITGAILSRSFRSSDWIEQIHDGSYFAPWIHDWIMPVAAVGLMFLVGSGIYLWLDPIIKRRRRKRRRALSATPPV